MINRRSLVAAAIASPVYLKEGFAQAPEITLKMHHFLAPVSNGHAKLLAPWAKMVEDDSKGRIKIQIFPAMQLGGAPPQLFDQAKDGVADIVWTLPGSTPGRFMSTEPFELPFFANKKGETNAKAMQEYANKYMKDEFKDVTPLITWAHDGGLFHTSKPLKTMADLQGMKLRFPTRLAGEGLRALGVNAIGMPVPQVPESLANGVIDGAVVPWEIVPALKLQELLKYHTEVPGSPTFYSTSFVLAMNSPKYNSLPNDLKAIIDARSGMFGAAMAGKMWDDQATAVSAMVKARAGNTVSTISEEEAKLWQEKTKPVTENWIKLAKEKGLPAENMLADAQALIKKYS